MVGAPFHSCSLNYKERAYDGEWDAFMHWPLDVGEREDAAGLVVGFVVGLDVVVTKESRSGGCPVWIQGARRKAPHL